MCYLELPRVLVNNKSINKTLQSLRNTCTRQRTTYSKRKVTKLWEHFPRFSNSKRALCNRKVFFRPWLPIDAKEENVCNGLARVLSLFPCLGSRIPNTLRFMKTPWHKTAPTCSSLAKPWAQVMLDCAYLILLCSCKTNARQIESVVCEIGTSYSFSSQPDLYLLETTCVFLEPPDVRVEQV
jgi:hypothetical protein